MSKSIRVKSILLVALLSLFAPVTVFSQSGKIAGRVTDAATGDPLPGVNVIIDGTTLGTATGPDGDYVIIGVRPGTYTITASFIGYTTQKREDVRVSVDLTTTVDFELGEEVLEGEEIVVTAEYEVVRKDLTSSESRVTAETIENLPVQEVGDLLSAQAGVTMRGGGLHIRGGRSSEVAYFIDGVRVSDAYDGSISVEVENDAIEELQVISGTFNAEYGQAMSGIINVVTKEGGRRLGGSFEAYTGSYLPDKGEVGEDFLVGRNREQYVVDGIEYRNAEPFGYLPFNATHYYNLQGTLHGPLVSDRLTFHTFVRYFTNEGWLYGANLFDINGQRGDSSLVPMNPYEKLSGQTNLRFRLNNNMTLNVIALASTAEGQYYDHSWRWAPSGRPTFYDRGYNVNLKFTHTLSARSFYTLNLARYYTDYKRHLFEDPFDPRYNDFLINTPDTVVTGGQRFLRGGTDLRRFERSTVAHLLKFDFTRQFGNHHLVKFGAEGRLDQLKLRDYELIGAPDAGEDVPFIPIIPDSTTSRHNRFDVDPLTFSGFIQDKIEFETFIVNAGLRFDWFNARSRVPADPEDPNIYNPFKDKNRYRDLNGNNDIDPEEKREDNLKTVEEREAYWWKETTPKFQLSPRLGVAYPITAEGVIHFSYGHFLQIPTFNRLFDNSLYKVTTEGTLFGPFGNPDLAAEKTVMYELGLQQGIGDFLVDLTGFYRDVRNWVSTSVPIESELAGTAYVIYANRDYSNVRGVTLKLSKRFSNHYSFDVNYTFQVAEGSNSSPDEEFFSRQNNEQPTIALLPLNWDQRHTASASILVGGSGWGISTLTRFGSGYPYTPFFGQAETRGQNVTSNFPRNSRRIAPTLDVDLYAFKDFDLGPISPRVFVQVYNALDRGNEENVFADTGAPDVTIEQKRIGAFDPGWFVRPDFYAEPRRIQIGMDIRF